MGTTRVGIIFGGRSAEHEAPVQSGREPKQLHPVGPALAPEQIDGMFSIMHVTPGDGGSPHCRAALRG